MSRETIQKLQLKSSKNMSLSSYRVREIFRDNFRDSFQGCIELHPRSRGMFPSRATLKAENLLCKNSASHGRAFFFGEWKPWRPSSLSSPSPSPLQCNVTYFCIPTENPTRHLPRAPFTRARAGWKVLQNGESPSCGLDCVSPVMMAVWNRGQCCNLWRILPKCSWNSIWV